MASIPKKVTIVEEGPREGFQIAKAPISTVAKVRLIEALSETGLKQIQVVSFVNPKRVPGMADADDVVARLSRREGVSYFSLWLNEQGLQRALAAASLDVRGRIVTCASEPFLVRNQNATWDQAAQQQRDIIVLCKSRGITIEMGVIQAAFGCNFAGDIGVAGALRSVDAVMTLADEADVKLRQLTLADTMGWATPQSVQSVIGAVQDQYPELELVMHLHDTRGMGMANAYASLQMGVSHFDTAIGGVGGCPFAGNKGAAGNVCTEDLAFMCEEMGIETGLDLIRLIEAAEVAESVFERPLPGAIKKAGLLSRLRASLAPA